jgi:hypothetical protein
MKTMAMRAFALGMLVSGCGLEGSGDIVTVKHDIHDASEIEVGSGLELHLSQASEPSLSVTGDDNLVDLLVIQQDTGSLRLVLPQSLGGLRPTRPIRVQLAVSDLTLLKLSDGVQANVIHLGKNVELDLSDGSEATFDSLSGSRVNVTLSDGSTLRVDDVETPLFELSMSDASRCVVSGGAVDSLVDDSTDSSSLEASALSVDSANVTLADASDVQLGKTGSIYGELTEASSLMYSGDAFVGDLEACDDCSVERADSK